MKLPTLCLLLGLIFLSSLAAQNRSFGTLPMARVTDPSAVNMGPIDSSAYQRALKVYERLAQARGDFRFPVPDFAMKNEKKSVAYINYYDMEVTLESKAYEVCASFGEAEMDGAIAFLIGHELTHYYEKHAWREGFVYEHQDLDIGLQLDSLADGAAQESEADYLGGFLAYSAGYGFFDKGDQMMDRLYAAYRLPEQIPGYPSLSDRKLMSQRSAEKLARLVDVFEMANLLTAVGKYKEALSYYRYLLMHYQSRETYNNVGVSTLLDAMQYFREGELKFKYPIQLDLESITARGGGEEGLRERMIRQALLHFDGAISLDPNYAPAYLNKACAFALLGDVERAKFYASVEGKAAAERGKYPKTATDIDILLGILADQAGDVALAGQYFQTAAERGSKLAAHNYNVLKQAPPPPPAPASFSLSQETIEGHELAILSRRLRVRLNKDVGISDHVQFRQSKPGGDAGQSHVFIHELNSPEKREKLYFHLTQENYTGESGRGIKIGDTYDALVAAYGQPLRTLETPNGSISVYNKNIFILDAQNKVKRWAVYQL